MALQNRVNPYGEICFSEFRGNLIGNRGCLHNKQQQIIRPYQLKRWIICVLSFKQRKRSLMSRGLYTELFFWDEASALASGHRPCAECQRERNQEFKKIWQDANSEPNVGLTEIDNFLHKERLNANKQYFPISELPSGIFVEYHEKPFLVYENKLFEWTFNGYLSAIDLPQNMIFKALTPASIIKTIQYGFRPNVVFKPGFLKEMIK
jgi:hypothetical protein